MSLSSPEARQFVIGTSSYHCLRCWLLETELEFKKPSQKRDAGISTYIYFELFSLSNWITHSSNLFLLFFRHYLILFINGLPAAEAGFSSVCFDRRILYLLIQAEM